MQKASIACDREGCTERESFPPAQRPPARWLVLEHPKLPVPVHAMPPRLISTFCSMPCLLQWADAEVCRG